MRRVNVFRDGGKFPTIALVLNLLINHRRCRLVVPAHSAFFDFLRTVHVKPSVSKTLRAIDLTYNFRSRRVSRAEIIGANLYCTIAIRQRVKLQFYIVLYRSRALKI